MPETWRRDLQGQLSEVRFGHHDCRSITACISVQHASKAMLCHKTLPKTVLSKQSLAAHRPLSNVIGSRVLCVIRSVQPLYSTSSSNPQHATPHQSSASASESALTPMHVNLSCQHCVTNTWSRVTLTTPYVRHPLSHHCRFASGWHRSSGKLPHPGGPRASQCGQDNSGLPSWLCAPDAS